MFDNIKINENQKSEYIKKGYWIDKTLNDCWNESVKKYPNREYIVDDRGFRYTYKQLDNLASKLASYLQNKGIGHNDIVSYQIPIWSEFSIITIACFKIGAIAHPIAMSYGEKQLIDSINLTESKIFFCPTYFYKTNYEQLAQKVLPNIKSLKDVVVLDNAKEKESSFCTLSEILNNYKPLKKQYIGKGDDVVAVLCTSGTTCDSKGVLLSNNNIRFSEQSFHKELDITENDIMFMPAPLSHATGFSHGIIAPMFTGSKVVLQQKYNCADAIELINKEKCTYSMGATPFIYDILRYIDNTDKTISSLNLYLCGGAPVPSDMVQKALKHNIILCEVYGSTESSPHAYVRPTEAVALNGKTSGRAISGVEIRVVDENGVDVPFGVQGEELSRGPNVFVGYLKNKELTNQVLDDDGWFHSGDLCIIDKCGNIKIIGRKKDMIIRGGENLDSNAINDNLSGFDKVLDHTVIGMPDDRLGERICLFVVPKKGYENLKLQDILDYLEKKGISKHFWPEHLELINRIPHTGSGKVKKYVLLKELNKRIQKQNEEV